MTPPDPIGLIVAGLGGAAVGLERQWSGHADGPTGRFAGIRTFTLLGVLAGLTGWLWTAGAAVLAAVLLGGAVAITAAGYVAASRRETDGTTEVAALVVLAAGILAGVGLIQFASAIVAIEVLLLVEKSRLHSIARKIDDTELRAGVRFAVMALVVLPLLPKGPFGPLGSFRPRELWILVLFFSGLSFLGYMLRQAIGPRRGYLWSGALGGLISSTNVTWTFARASKKEPSVERPLAVGTIAANAVLYLRVAAATAVLNVAILPSLAAYLATPFAVAALAVALNARKLPARDSASDLSGNPLQLSSALQMAVLFQFVLTAVKFAQATWGQAGVLTSAGVLGFTDVDALTLSMTRGTGGTVTPGIAALAIAIGIAANTVLKTGLAVIFGTSKFRMIVGLTLAAVLAASVASILLLPRL
jgi:uncharacterized membrane protein (DUF4010 family)